MSKSPELEALLNKFTQKTFGRTRTEAQAEQICVICGKSATHFRDKASAREYCISSMCQDCQDSFFEGD